jgi:hypothetical protein
LATIQTRDIEIAWGTGITAGSTGCGSCTCNSSGGVERRAGARCGIAAVAAGTGVAARPGAAAAVTTGTASTACRFFSI